MIIMALDQFRVTIELEKDFPQADFWMFFCYLAKGMHAEAIKKYQDFLSKFPEQNNRVTLAGQIFKESGMEGFYRWLIDERHIRRPYFLAIYNALLGKNDEAFKMLEMAYEKHQHRLRSVKVDPLLDNLRSDQRFTELLKRMDLGE